MSITERLPKNLFATTYYCISHDRETEDPQTCGFFEEMTGISESPPCSIAFKAALERDHLFQTAREYCSQYPNISQVLYPWTATVVEVAMGMDRIVSFPPLKEIFKALKLDFPWADTLIWSAEGA